MIRNKCFATDDFYAIVKFANCLLFWLIEYRPAFTATTAWLTGTTKTWNSTKRTTSIIFGTSTAWPCWIFMRSRWTMLANTRAWPLTGSVLVLLSANSTFKVFIDWFRHSQIDYEYLPRYLSVTLYNVRPPDVVVGGLIFHHGFVFLFSFFLSFFRPLISKLAERN